MLDEDRNGEITKKELFFALDLYKCNSERVQPTNAISPQLESVFKLIETMK